MDDFTLPGDGFGRVRSVDQQRSDALSAAAHNLLTRAFDAVLEGEDATAFVRRAMAVPFDEFERTHPASLAVETIVGQTLIDSMLLPGADRAPQVWLDEALAVLDELDGEQRVLWARLLVTHAATEDLHDHERKRIRARTGFLTPNQLTGLLASNDSLASEIERALAVAVDYTRRVRATMIALETMWLAER